MLPPMTAPRRLALRIVIALAAVLAIAIAGAAIAGAAFAGAASDSGSTLTLVTPAEPGTRLTVVGTLLDRSGYPVGGAEIHVYHTDASGRYTPKQPMDEPHARLSGRVRTDANGRFELRTVRPGRYIRPVRLGDRERWVPAHVHLDITAAGHAERRLQMVFADDSLLAEPYWKGWVKRLGQPVLHPRPRDRGLVGELTIVLP